MCPVAFTQLKRLKTALDDLRPEVDQLRVSGRRLADNLSPAIVAELRVDDAISATTAQYEQLLQRVDRKVEEFNAVLGPGYTVFEMLVGGVGLALMKLRDSVKGYGLGSVGVISYRV